MKNKINNVGCDMHKKYSVFFSANTKGGSFITLENDKSKIRNYLSQLPANTTIAIESTGSWYWMIDEIERAGHKPILAHAHKSKLMMGNVNKTDKLDAKGLATLLQNNTIPSIWVPPGELRDIRELSRWRMTLVKNSTAIKNRIHAQFSKYGIKLEGAKDLFGKKGKEIIKENMNELPNETKNCVEQQLSLLSQIQEKKNLIEKRLCSMLKETDQMKLLQTAPGIGKILSMTILLETGDMGRFPSSSKFAAYCGTLPRIYSSGGKTFHGNVPKQCNRYLKWAFVEAANVICRYQKKHPDQYVVKRYQKIKNKKGHAKAAVAIARHLAEATYWMLTKKEPYKAPKDSSTSGQTRN